MKKSVKTRKVSGVESIEPAITPLADSPVIPRTSKVPPIGAPRLDIPQGLWTKCPKCSELLYDKYLDDNLKVCMHCAYHFPYSARERINSLVETCSFEEMDADLRSVDILSFSGPSSYPEKLQQHEKATNLRDAIITGVGKVGEYRVALGVMDFKFLGGSMGSVVGEKITRLVEEATDRSLPVIIFSASGGARMYEGVFSLMQMAKTSAALAFHSQANLPFISVLTDPTTGGVTASFASLGDVILAEPHAMIGFAGPRVIRDTTHADLPPGFQTSEFLMQHGFIDLIVDRTDMKRTLVSLLGYMSAPKASFFETQDFNAP